MSGERDAQLSVRESPGEALEVLGVLVVADQLPFGVVRGHAADRCQQRHRQLIVNDPVAGPEDGIEPVDHRDVLTDLPFQFDEPRALISGDEPGKELSAFDLLEHVEIDGMSAADPYGSFLAMPHILPAKDAESDNPERKDRRLNAHRHCAMRVLIRVQTRVDRQRNGST